MLNYILNLPSFLLRKYKSKKISFSLTSIDLLISYIFRNKRKGIFIDIGCNHPVYNNNTYLLYKKGWRGINIDLDEKSINLFNTFRKSDLNIKQAISSKAEEVDLYFYHNKSPINTINKDLVNFHKTKPKQIKKINTKTLNSIIMKTPFANEKIDFMNIDVEGHELNVLKGFDLKKYSPTIIVIEYLDLNVKKLEITNFNLQNIINSEIYKYMINNNYTLVNWIHSDLVFVNNNYRD
tara:strand:- start:615 stop:1325 length:711 start_codon:yes stop_codon:yes gene_type:complete